VFDKFEPDFIATGHYAKLINKDGEIFLSKPHDLNKDQTYFLCQINKNIFSKIIFPLDNIDKSEVRKIAEEINLINSKKKDSTGICFIGENKFENFLLNYFPEKRGEIVNVKNGEVIGFHKGSIFYTIGQRKNLNLSGNQNPFYVVGKDVEKNVVYAADGWDNE
jgi:tRNA-specific 2-thiouridylase